VSLPLTPYLANKIPVMNSAVRKERPDERGCTEFLEPKKCEKISTVAKN
jgi:hypothetical protein